MSDNIEIIPVEDYEKYSFNINKRGIDVEFSDNRIRSKTRQLIFFLKLSYSFIVCRKSFLAMVNLTEKIKDALTNTKESASETKEIGELCMACGKDFDSGVELQKHMKTEHQA
jgi:hypothetical protein